MKKITGIGVELMNTNQSIRCFVMMPSGNHGEYVDGTRESDFIYNHIIVPATKEACGKSVDIIREADSNTPGSIDRRIVEHLATADICIVDITGQNANVFFELGIRFALCKSTTILLKQQDTTVPFDITSYRIIEYEPKWEGFIKAKQEITRVIKVALEAPKDASDSLVFNVYPKLDVSLFPEKRSDFSDRMTWETYWSRFMDIQSRLKETVDDGRYKPSALLGLSNGGMIAADILGRRLFRGTPITTFWVNRFGTSTDSEWFDHKINSAVIEGLKAIAQDKEEFEILLVDDIVASGRTIQDALKYLNKHLPQASVRFLPIFSGNEHYYDLIKTYLIWLHPAFSEIVGSDEQIAKIHATKLRKLPYDKDIRSS